MHFLKKRLRLVIAGVAFAVVAVLGVSHTAFATSWATFELSSESGVGTAYCMNNTAGSSTNGNAQELWTCSGGAHLGYAMESSTYGDGNWQQIIIEGTNKCLSGQGGGDNTPVVEYQCNGSANQAVCWQTNGFSVAHWQFEDNMSIGDHDDTQTNGNPIVMWTYNESNSESWFGPAPMQSNDNCSTV